MRWEPEPDTQVSQQGLAVVERGDEDVRHGLGSGTERHGAYRICELLNGCLRLTHCVWLTRGPRIIRCAQITVDRRPRGELGAGGGRIVVIREDSQQAGRVGPREFVDERGVPAFGRQPAGFQKARIPTGLRVRPLLLILFQAVLRYSWMSPSRTSWRWIRRPGIAMASGASAGARSCSARRGLAEL